MRTTCEPRIRHREDLRHNVAARLTISRADGSGGNRILRVYRGEYLSASFSPRMRHSSPTVRYRTSVSGMHPASVVFACSEKRQVTSAVTTRFATSAMISTRANSADESPQDQLPPGHSLRARLAPPRPPHRAESDHAVPPRSGYVRG